MVSGRVVARQNKVRTFLRSECLKRTSSNQINPITYVVGCCRSCACSDRARVASDVISSRVCCSRLCSSSFVASSFSFFFEVLCARPPFSVLKGPSTSGVSQVHFAGYRGVSRGILGYRGVSLDISQAFPTMSHML